MKSRESNYGNASVHQRQDGTIAIENPGYIPSETSVDFNKDEHPYSTVDSQGIRPVLVIFTTIKIFDDIQCKRYQVMNTKLV